MNQEIFDFANDILIPCAFETLRSHYDVYCKGEDIGVETKADMSPASCADFETEKALRALIKGQYPDHGIWGEEFGGENLDRDYVWVLDPLDGTKDFLAKSPGGFGTLIGLLYKGRAVMGFIGDPMSEELWTSENQKKISNDTTLQNSIVACTNPEGMFETTQDNNFIQNVLDNSKECKTNLNCIGFSSVVDGVVDVAIENDLKIHDIVALIPVLKNAGATVIDFDEDDYSEMRFDLSQEKKYGMIAAANDVLAQEILSMYKQREAA